MPTELSSNKAFSARVIAVKQLTGDISEFDFKLEGDFSFVPGQYVWVEIPDLIKNDPRGGRRAFSICNLPNKNGLISIVARISPSGFKQTLFGLKAGDRVVIHGPFGSLQFPQKSETPLVCIAGGVGIAPLLSLIPDSLSKFPDRKVTLVYSNRPGQGGPFAEYFRKLHEENSGFTLIEVQGKVTENTLAGINNSFPFAAWVIIGPKPMVYFVASTLYSLSVEEKSIIFDEFFVSKTLVENLSLGTKTQDFLDMFSLAMQQTGNHVILTDVDGYITFANKSAEKITGYTFSEMQGQTPRLWGGLEPPEFYQKLWRTIKIEKKPFSAEIKNRRKNGDYYDAIAHISPFLDKEGDLLGFMATEEDISKLKEIDRMKTEFVSLASHQLRTPLTAIKWGLESIIEIENENLSDKQKEYINYINNSNERMIDLVNSLLNISRIESGRIALNPQLTDVAKLLSEVSNKLKAELVKKNISLIVNVESNLPKINLDNNLIFNVFQNLIGNSISYSPPGSKIYVSIINKEGQIISSVQDSGIGIPESEKENIYNKFYRATNARQVRPDGSGLGLYIVKSIVESSGGKIWFESNEGRGTTFHFSLPLTGMVAKAGEVSLS